MPTYSTNEFKKGLRVVIDGEPYILIEAEHYKPGKGHAYMRTKIKNLKTGRVLDRTYLSGEKLEGADCVDATAQYLYQTDDIFHFMLEDGSFEQLEVSEKVLGETRSWLKIEGRYTLTIWNGEAILVTAPSVVELEVQDTDPGVKGDTATGGSKPATLETGAVIRVPLFVKIGDKIKVNTESSEYLGRSNS